MKMIRRAIIARGSTGVMDHLRDKFNVLVDSELEPWAQGLIKSEHSEQYEEAKIEPKSQFEYEPQHPS